VVLTYKIKLCLEFKKMKYFTFFKPTIILNELFLIFFRIHETFALSRLTPIKEAWSTPKPWKFRADCSPSCPFSIIVKLLRIYSDMQKIIMQQNVQSVIV